MKTFLLTTFIAFLIGVTLLPPYEANVIYERSQDDRVIEHPTTLNNKPAKAPETTKTSKAPETTTKTSKAPETTTKTSKAPETTTKTSKAPETTTNTSKAPETTTKTSKAPETTTSPTTTQSPDNISKDLENEVKKVFKQFEIIKLDKNKSTMNDLKKELLDEIKNLEQTKLNKEEEEDTIKELAFLQKLQIQNDIIRIESGVEIFQKTIDKIDDYMQNKIDFRIADHSGIINAISSLSSEKIEKILSNLTGINSDIEKGEWKENNIEKKKIKKALNDKKNEADMSYNKWIGSFAQEQFRIDNDQKELILVQEYEIESNLKVLNEISHFIVQFLPILDLYE